MRPRGFTLIEVVVALTIAAMALAIVPVSAARLYDTMEYRSAVRDVLSGLKAARLEAARSNRPVLFTLDTAEHRYWVGNGRVRELPEKIRLGLIVAEQDIEAARGSIRFFPDGGSTGGSVMLQRASGDGVRLRVDWLLGSITQESLN